MEELLRAFNIAVIDLRASLELCKLECDNCYLLCMQSRFHEGEHDCLADHDCIHKCAFCDKKVIPKKPCGQMWVY